MSEINTVVVEAMAGERIVRGQEVSPLGQAEQWLKFWVSEESGDEVRYLAKIAWGDKGLLVVTMFEWEPLGSGGEWLEVGRLQSGPFIEGVAVLFSMDTSDDTLRGLVRLTEAMESL